MTAPSGTLEQADSGVSGLLRDSPLGQVLAEYVWPWLSPSNVSGDLRCKMRVLSSPPASIDDVPAWHFELDGCGLAHLQPRFLTQDPFRSSGSVLVLCDVYLPPRQLDEPLSVRVHPCNNRAPCRMVLDAAAAAQPLFGVTQQYTLLDHKSHWPIGWREGRPLEGSAASHCCGVGRGSVIGREFAEAHLTACCQAGLKLSGIRADIAPGQWSYSLGPCSGVELGDQLWLSRYILLRLSEQQELLASLDPKPVPGDWSGTGALVKYSTVETRNPNKGLQSIDAHVRMLQQAHLQHLMVYGPGNAERLTGLHRPSSVACFTAGIEDHTASISVPQSTVLHSCGYYMDRRPASNMDPYLVTMMLVSTTLGVPLPLGALGVHQQDSSGAGESQSASDWRGSSALIDDIDHSAMLGPATPDGMPGPLASHCSHSEHHTNSGMASSWQ